MGTLELRHRIKLASVGWYHNVVIARKKWTTSRPPVWDSEDVQAGRVSNLEIATALAEWASPDFRRKIRSDVDELPDDAEELVDNYRRKELLSMYHSMIQSRGYTTNGVSVARNQKLVLILSTHLEFRICQTTPISANFYLLSSPFAAHHRAMNHPAQSRKRLRCSLLAATTISFSWMMVV